MGKSAFPSYFLTTDIARTWFPAAYRDSLPEYSIAACAGNSALIARAFYEDEMLPTLVQPDKFCDFVLKNGKEYKKSKYDVLVGLGYSWKRCSNGEIPPNAVNFDNRKSDEEIFIGRVLYQNEMYMGRVDSSKGCLYFTYNGRERHVGSFDVLVLDKLDSWISTSFHYTPADAVEGGVDTDGAIIYVGRALVDGQWVPAKIIPSKTCAYVCHKGIEVFVRNYQILRGHGYLWHKVYGHFIPSNAVTTGSTVRGEPLYVGRGNFRGSLTPGLISVNSKCCILPYGGRAISVVEYDALIQK